MPTFLQNGADWHAEKRKDFAGIECVYRYLQHVLDLTLMPKRNNAERRGRDLLREEGFITRTDDFAGVTADFEIEGTAFLPRYENEIEWTDEIGQPRIACVWPRVNGRCYDFTGPTKKHLLIYTVAQEDLKPLKVKPAGSGQPFEVKAILSGIRGVQDFGNYGAETRVLQMTAYVPRADFTANGMDVQPANATYECNGSEGWVIEHGLTEWGTGLVKLGLQRETLVREWQARRNAAV